jgi:hypothetical protein
MNPAILKFRNIQILLLLLLSFFYLNAEHAPSFPFLKISFVKTGFAEGEGEEQEGERKGEASSSSSSSEGERERERES